MSKSPPWSPEFSVCEFCQGLPADDACVAHIMQVLFGGTRFQCSACGKERSHHKLAARRTFVCANCGHQVNPTAKAILHETRTPLASRYYAVYLF